ncbi:MAG: AAA family ATPase [Pseudonocardia sp.]
MHPPDLRLRLLGPLTVEGELSATLPTGKARRVLAVLGIRRGEFVPVETLVDALWDASAPERADRNVAALVSRLRRALGRDRIEGGAAAYRLAPEGFAVDLLEAAELVEAAEHDLGHGRFALAATGAEHAAKLLDADTALAGEREDPWVADLRRDVGRWLHRARVCWSAATCEIGSHDVAVEVASAVLRDDPVDEQACRTVMLAHHRAGRSGSALMAYRALRRAMSEQLGSDPSPATQSLFLSVLRSEPTPGQDRGIRTVAIDAGGPAVLVGRGAELAALRELWDAAATGTPALVVVAGEAGIGKSALVSAFADGPRRTGALVLETVCAEAERSLYLQPLVTAVRTAVQRTAPTEVRELAGSRPESLAELVPELAGLLGAGPYQRAGPELEHRRSLDAITGFLRRLATRRPVLLVVEDAQFLGRSTVEALHLLTGQWAGTRLMVVVVERTTEDAPVTDALRDVAARIEPGPLSAEDVALLARRAGRPADGLHARTGGSPLILTEVLRHPGAAVPTSLHQAVSERIDHAGEDTAALLGQGAVLGRTFSLDDVAQLSGLDAEECAARAARALRAGLLVTQGGDYRFANDIVRQVAYDAVPEPVRLSRHRRAAALFDGRPEKAAGQLAAAGDWRAAVRAWTIAADAAHLAFAHTECEHLLDRAVDAARSSGDRGLLAVTLMRRGCARSDLGRHDGATGARADHEAALALARELGDAELEARALEQLGWTALYARDAMVAVGLAERATELAESAAAAPGALPSAALLLGRVRHWDGDYRGAEQAYQRALDADHGETTTAMALAYSGALLQHQDRFAEAKSVLARAVVLCRRTGQFRPLLQALFFTALARGDTGDFAGALRALDNARRLIDADGVSFYRAGIETTTSWLWQELGQVERAREHALVAVDLARRGGGALELEQELHALLAIADCDLLLGRPDDAAAAVEAAAPMLERSLPFRPRAAMRMLEMRARWDATHAEALLEQARTYSSTKYEALALHALGRPDEAAAVATRTGSDLVVAQLGTPTDRPAALDRIAASLPTELREPFVAHGRLSVPAPRTR